MLYSEKDNVRNIPSLFLLLLSLLQLNSSVDVET